MTDCHKIGQSECREWCSLNSSYKLEGQYDKRFGKHGYCFGDGSWSLGFLSMAILGIGIKTFLSFTKNC